MIGDGTAILTAAHVICGSKHCVILASEKGEAEIETQLLQKNKVAAVLSVNSSLHCESANIFQIRKFLTTIYRGRLKDILPMNNLPMR